MENSSLEEQKRRLRALARQRRQAVENAAQLSQIILDRALQLPAYRQARVVMFYVDAGSEVQTRLHLPRVLADGKLLVVPWCEDDHLQLFRLEAIDELGPGMYNILEPRPEWRRRPERRVAATVLDVVLAPGVAFDPQGRRLGQGRGYYDRLFPQLRPDAIRIGLAFEAQMFPNVPVAEHDVQMHHVVTEARVYSPESLSAAPHGAVADSEIRKQE